MNFEVGKLYVTENNEHTDGCVFEYAGCGDNVGILKFNIIKPNAYFKCQDFRIDRRNVDTFGFKPLIATLDDVYECENEDEEAVERVDHPAHYNQGIEAIEYIESHNMDFNTGNVIKYVTRAKHKGTYLEDLKKARWYLDRLIEKGLNDD